VTARCPDGHESAPPASDEDVTRVTKSEPCPTCHARLQPGDRFCEKCGHDVTAAPSAGRWIASVAADPEFHQFLSPDGIDFPSDPGAPRTITIDAAEIGIGRIKAPADREAVIDLSVEPVDPAASRNHACLKRQDDGSYAVVDVGSANGTWVNDDPTPITVGAVVPLAAGDRVHVGAWTTITVYCVND
jgi:hypothetical protein